MHHRQGFFFACLSASVFSVIILASEEIYAPPYAFSHLAGAVKGPGVNDGYGPSAQFNLPSAVAVDAAGTIYVADFNALRRVSSTGHVSTLAGKGWDSGNVDSYGSSARFGSINGLAVDHSGNIYAADLANRSIRRITPSGYVTTFVESFTPWTADPKTSIGMTVDATDNLYVSTTDHLILKITPAGIVTIFAGSSGGYADGPRNAARFLGPAGLACDQQGNVYVADSGNNVMRKIGVDGQVTTLAGTRGQTDAADGIGPAAHFEMPTGVALDATGNLFVCDATARIIRKIDPAGRVSTLAGVVHQDGWADGPATEARFHTPKGLALNAAGRLYVVDSFYHTLREISSDGRVTTLAGYAGLAEEDVDGVGALGHFRFISGIALDPAGNLYVVGNQTSSLRRVSPDGTVVTIGKGSGLRDEFGHAASLSAPEAVAADADGNAYIADGYAVRKVTAAGVLTTVAGAPRKKGYADGPATSALFNRIAALTRDLGGNLYVADTAGTIRKISADGLVTTLAGRSGDLGPPVDGSGSAARFWGMAALTVDRTGNLYLADDITNVIRKISPEGVVSTIAGTSGVHGRDDGKATQAKFSFPSGLAVDAAGNVFVADSGNNLIRRITPAGAVTTVAGDGLSTHGGSTDGYGKEARFLRPAAIAVDDHGTIYVGEEGNVDIRRGVPGSSRLANISARGFCGTDDRVMIGGFVVGGTGTKRVLVRAIGPSLAAQGLPASNILADPEIEVHQGAAIIAQNDNWTENTNLADLAQLRRTVGANNLSSDDRTSAEMILTLAPGVYSFVTKGHGGGSGIVLLEVYDGEPEGSSSAFLNISTRAYSTGGGNGVTIGGFVIAGSTPKKVLLRALGPTLGGLGISPASLLADPLMELHDAVHQNVVMTTNDDWGTHLDASDLPKTSARLGATPMATDDDRSSVLAMTLAPGPYSFVVSGKAGKSGITLVEVYDAE